MTKTKMKIDEVIADDREWHGSSGFSCWRKVTLWLDTSVGDRGGSVAMPTVQLLVLESICGLEFDTDHGVWLDDESGLWNIGRLDSIRLIDTAWLPGNPGAELAIDYGYETRGGAMQAIYNMALRAGATS